MNPALLRCRTQVKLAIPEPFWPHTLEIVDEKWETVVEKDAFVRPVQHLRAGTTPDDSHEEKHEESVHCASDCSCRTQRPVRHPLTQGLPAPAFVPPDPVKYENIAAEPAPPARAVRIDTVGTTSIAVIELNPVRITPHGELRLCTSMTLRVDYARTAPLGDQRAAHKGISDGLGCEIDLDRVVPQPQTRHTDGKELSRLTDIAKGEVLKPKVLEEVAEALLRWPIFDLPCEYLIVTDDCTWDAATVSPGGSVPGMVAAFERLATAKSARGISTRVVTITDIVGGRYGDYRTGSRDLQEVIRKFLKHARGSWGVSWLLLGGDTAIVPVRQVAGAFEGHVSPDTNSTPDDNKSYWTGSYLKMHAKSPGTWWGATIDNQLVRPDTGELIPYDSMGTSSSTSPGWYFTASDYTTRSAMTSEYVHVNGPAGLVNATLQFLYHWNTLPTDFYYASLNSWVVLTQHVDFGGFFSFDIPYVYVPEHDWDATNNGIYGQHHSDGTDLDGVVLHTDLSVGRAPVDDATQATTFVDKVLAYESLRLGSFSLDHSRWPSHMLLASSDWGGRSWFAATPHTTPAIGEYHHDAGAQASLLKKDGVPDSFDYELIAHVSDTDRRVLPFKMDPNPGVRGWYYATSENDHSLSQLTIPMPFGWPPIVFPMPSEWIVVHGSLTERTPAAFEHDPTSQEGSMDDQEKLRAQIRSEVPGISDFHRFYEDEIDLSFLRRIAAPVDYLTTATLTAGLNAAPHIVSLSGHGSGDGCCGGSVGLANGLINGLPGFIGYADSCLTNEFDSNDAFSEALLNNASGGAVAYVGNTRFSWIGVGDDFQRAFFHRLTATRHLGLLNDSRVDVYGTSGAWSGYERWAIFTLNLLGDPEMQVYRGPVPWRPLRVETDVKNLVMDRAPIADYYPR